jgi:hypothetical protein
VDSVVLSDYRSQGVGGKLIEARCNVIRKLNLRGLVAGSLPIDYSKVAEHVSIEQYVRDVVAGTRFDTNLSKQLRKGFKAHGLIPNYTTEPSCGGYGVQIVWDNPDYRPLRRAFPAAVPARIPVIRQMPAPLMPRTA